MNDKKEGHGIYYYAHGDRYEGNSVNDKREGHGVFYQANGDRYEGNYVNGKREGHGVEYNKDGTIKLKGEWKEGKFVGSK